MTTIYPAVAAAASTPDPVGRPSVARPGWLSTAQLSAAAYSDQGYARAVVDRVLRRETLDPAPSFGVDAPTVARHCVRAARWVMTRRLLVAGLSLVGLALAAVDPGLTLLFVLGVVSVSVGYELLVFRRSHQLRASGGAPGGPEPSTPGLRAAVARVARAGTLGVPTYTNAVVTPRVVGYGRVEETWSVAVRLRPQAQPEDAPVSAGQVDVTPSELHERLDTVLAATVARQVRPSPWVSLGVRPHVFLNGLVATRCDGRPLPLPPEPPVASELQNQVAAAAPGLSRRYTGVQAVSWDGELVLTTLARLGVDGTMLSVEVLSIASAPLRAACRPLVTLRSPTPRSVLAVASRGVLLAPWRALDAFGGLALRLQALADELNPFAGEREQAYRSIYHVVSPQASVRDLAESAASWGLFAQADLARQRRVHERYVLECLTEVLADCGYRVDELEEKITLIDNSLTISNSTVAGSSIAQGQASASAGGRPGPSGAGSRGGNR